MEWLKEKALPGIEKGEDMIWVLCPKEGADKGTAIGNIHYRLTKQIPDSDRGFWLAQPYWGQGLMGEAVEVTQDFMFFEYAWEAFMTRNAHSNVGSRRLKEKSGAKLVRVEEKPCGHMDGPTEIWEITRENWDK